MRRDLIEPCALTLLLLVLFKICQLTLPSSWIAVIVPTLLLYPPVILMTRQKKPIDFLFGSFKKFAGGILTAFIAIGIVFPPYVLAAHYWMLHVFDFGEFMAAPLSLFTENLLYQLLVVALPEEFYFRGYMQSTLQNFFKPRWKILGARLGWGWILTALVFALAHSILNLEWWHFSIFFPALLFGYLREKTGSIAAPVLFHAFSNCFMNWFLASYS